MILFKRDFFYRLVVRSNPRHFPGSYEFRWDVKAFAKGSFLKMHMGDGVFYKMIHFCGNRCLLPPNCLRARVLPNRIKSAIKKYTERGKIAYIITKRGAGFEVVADRLLMDH
jgi:hypothetical protein